MLNFCSLYSGSSGNSLFVETENTKILVDAGMSCKKIEEALNSIESFSIIKLRLASSISFILLILSSILAAQFAQSIPSIEYTFFIVIPSYIKFRFLNGTHNPFI